MRFDSEHSQAGLTPVRQSFCLTNLSITSLVGCAIAVSAVLWLCILAVL